MTVQILTGDSRTRLKELASGSVHCVVTSPPYFQLRDYDVDEQMGLEATPDEFVAALVALFREVRRVLRDDGTLWLNIGDSYANDSKWGGSTGGKHVLALHGDGPMRARTSTGLKSKELMGIPWRLAFALSADGWTLRQDDIWHKPDPMPESVQDRCTKAHEYLFMLTKSSRYYFDAEAIAEPAIWSGDRRNGQGRLTYEGKRQGKDGTGNEAFVAITETRNKRSVWTVASEPFGFERCIACKTTYSPARHRPLRRERIRDDDGNVVKTLVYCACGRSDAWLSHFATFPPALIKPCILAGCPESCCEKCGAPVVRESVTRGWKSSCGCKVGFVPGLVLDPFGGAGTTGLVADRLRRRSILIELNPEYAALAKDRIEFEAGMFAKVEAA